MLHSSSKFPFETRAHLKHETWNPDTRIQEIFEEMLVPAPTTYSFFSVSIPRSGSIPSCPKTTLLTYPEICTGIFPLFLALVLYMNIRFNVWLSRGNWDTRCNRTYWLIAVTEIWDNGWQAQNTQPRFTVTVQSVTGVISRRNRDVCRLHFDYTVEFVKHAVRVDAK